MNNGEYFEISNPNALATVLRMLRDGGAVPTGTAGSAPPSRSRRVGSSKPAVNIKEEEKIITIYVDLAGIPKDQIDIQFNNNKLNIRAERINPLPENDYNEIYYGVLEKTITLPICVTQKETVTVSHDNGVLKIILDKTREERNRFCVRIEN